MKYLIIFFVFSCYLSTAQIAPPTFTISNTGGLSTGTYSVYNEYDVIVSDQITNDATMDIKANHETVLLPSTDLISYTSSGSFHASIRTSDLSPVSFHPYGWTGIGKHD